MPATEVTAIVLAAGTGSRLEDILPTDLPKCLLPVGNHPLLNYVLTWLEAGGIKSIPIVLCSEDAERRNRSATSLKSFYCDALVAVRAEELDAIKDAIASGTAKLTSSLTPKFIPLQPNPVTRQQNKGNNRLSINSMEAESDAEVDTFSLSSDDSDIEDDLEDDEEQELEPVDCLHQMIKFVKTNNVLIVPCDLVTSFNLSELLNAHLFGVEHAAVMALFHPYPDGLTEAISPGHTRRMAVDFPMVTVTAGSLQMLHYVPPGDVSAGDELVVPTRVLCPASTVSSPTTPLRLLSRMCDLHLYIFRTQILEKALRASNRRIHASIRDDLLPFVIDQQTLPEKKRVVTMADFGLDEITRKAMNWFRQGGDEPRTHTNPLEKRRSGERFGSSDPIRCYGYEASNSTFAIRVNTVANFVLANLNLSRFWHSFPISNVASVSLGSKENANASISSKAKVGNDVVMGSGCVVGEKAVVNRCVLGRHCRVAENAKVTGSVLFDNADIGPGCVVQNSIVCAHSVLEEKCEVQESIVVAKHTVPKGTKHPREIVGSEFKLDLDMEEDDDY